MSVRAVGALFVLVAAAMSLGLPVGARAGLHAVVGAYSVSAESVLLAVHVGTGDFNGDGRLDLASAALAMAGGDVTVHFGRGDGSFLDGEVYETDPRPGSIATADFDGDGNDDMVLPSDTSNRLTLLYGGSDSAFEVDHVVIGFPTNSVDVGDVDGDRQLDVVAASPGQVFVLLGDGEGGFGVPVPYATGGGGYGSVAVGDFDADGRADVVAVPGPGNQSVAVLLGNSDGSLRAPRATSVPGCCPSGIAVGDFNADRRSDVVVTYAFTRTASLLLANADGSLGPPVSLSASAYGTPAVGDANGDGHLDLALGWSDGATVLVGTGTGTFAPPITLAGTGQLGVAVSADLNRDGFSDLVLSDAREPRVIVAVNAPSALASTNALSFASLAVNTPGVAQTLLLTNDGQPPLAISGLTLGGPNPGDFRVTSDGCTAIPVPAGKSCAIAIASTPTGPGARSAHLTISSNSAGGLVPVALSAVGVQPASPIAQIRDATAPTITLTVARQRLATVLKRGLRVTVGCSEACALDLRLLRARRNAANQLLARRPARLAAAGKRNVTLRVTARARRSLRGRRTVTLTLRVQARDNASNQRTATRSVTLRR